MAKTRRLLGTQAVRYPHMSPPLGDAKIGDSLVKLDTRDRLAAGICQGAVALDVPDNPAGSVPNLNAPPAPWIVDIPQALT